MNELKESMTLLVPHLPILSLRHDNVYTQRLRISKSGRRVPAELLTFLQSENYIFTKGEKAHYIYLPKAYIHNCNVLNRHPMNFKHKSNINVFYWDSFTQVI